MNRSLFAAWSLNPPKVAVGDLCCVSLMAINKIDPDFLSKNNINNRAIIKKYNPFDNIYLVAFGSVMNLTYGWATSDSIDVLDF